MAFDGLIGSVTEVVAYVIGKFTGRVFKIDPHRAEKLGILIVVGIIAVAGLTVTLLYS